MEHHCNQEEELVEPVALGRFASVMPDATEAAAQQARTISAVIPTGTTVSAGAIPARAAIRIRATRPSRVCGIASAS